MTKTARMLALERQWGRPIEEIMVAVYSQMGFTGACRALRISVNTLSRWEQVLGLDLSMKPTAGKKRKEVQGAQTGPG